MRAPFFGAETGFQDLSVGFPLGGLLGSLGAPWGLFGPPLVPLGRPRGRLGPPWVPFWAPLGSLGSLLGILWAAFGVESGPGGLPRSIFQHFLHIFSIFLHFLHIFSNLFINDSTDSQRQPQFAPRGLLRSFLNIFWIFLASFL